MIQPLPSFELPKSPLVIAEKQGIKLVKEEDEYRIINGKKVYKYKSSTWAAKKYDRFEKIYERRG